MTDVIAQGRQVVSQEIELVWVAMVSIDRGAGIAVDIQPALIELHLRLIADGFHRNASECGRIFMAMREKEFQRSSVSRWVFAVSLLTTSGRRPRVPSSALPIAITSRRAATTPGCSQGLRGTDEAPSTRAPPARPARWKAIAASAPTAPTSMMAEYVSVSVRSARVRRHPPAAPSRSTP